jgi:glucan phosphoethanolaminetransferase (alkaline phosphatase superfamily)
MAADGFNSLLLDMRSWHPYQPDNRLRLLTGFMAGIALAAAIFLLIGMAIWRRPRVDLRVVGGAWEPFLLLALQAPFAAAALSGAPWLYAPVALALALSAVTVVSAMMFVVVVMVRMADNTFDDVRQIQGYAVVGLLLGLVVMAVFGGGRFLLEAITNAPPLT